MTSREKVRRIFDLKSDSPVAFWTGCPWGITSDGYIAKLGLKDREELFQYFHDDCRWFEASCYKHPEGKPMFDPTDGKTKTSHGQAGRLADATSVRDVEKLELPDPKYLDFTDVLANIRRHPDKAIFSGLWTPFFHYLCDYFGMEEFFIKMYTHPEVVEALADRVLNFFLEANRRFFEAAGDEVEIFFFGNDFGSQLDVLISPENFKRFVLPGFKKLIDLAHSYGKKTLLHSCGSIIKVLPLLVDAGMDGLHPLQALAAGMEAENLARNFRGKIAFVGGIDTQQLLVHGTPEQVRADVRRVKRLLGPNLVVSPSHEAILPNVPLENVIAMAEEARA